MPNVRCLECSGRKFDREGRCENRGMMDLATADALNDFENKVREMFKQPKQKGEIK